MRNDRMQEGSTAVALAMVTPGYDQDPASGVADYASHQDQAQFEADKRAVYKHPLFPLLALLFERCEQATQSSDHSSSENFNMDIQAFVQHQENDRKPFLVNDPEIDGLMIKAIQVLRIHLLELEKVQELCKDFCNRYITCLKGKMQSENLLRSDYSHHGGHDGMAPSSGSNGSSPLQVLSSTGNDVEPGANGFRVSVGSRGGGADSVPSENGSSGGGGGSHSTAGYLRGDDSLHYNNRPASTRSSSSDAYSTTRHQRYQSDVIHQEYDDQRSVSPVTVHGGTPLSQIGAHHYVPVPQPTVNDMYLGQGSPSSMQSDEDSDACNLASIAGVGSLMGDSKKQKRGVLPKQATSIMRAWLFQHMTHPYPTEDEKREIANQTNLTLLQVNNWFINARRRILQPMMDGSLSTTTADPPIASVAGSHQQQMGNSNSGNKSKSKARSSSVGSGSTNSGRQRSLQRQQREQQGDWQSDDSGSESNDVSDVEGGYGYDGLKIDHRTQPVDLQDDNSEDGGIDIEDSKPFVH